jgi:hypothetical protein
MVEMITCVSCERPVMTWAEQRQQYGRLVRHGFTPEEIKRRMPLCRQCTTILLRWAPSKPQQQRKRLK